MAGPYALLTIGCSSKAPPQLEAFLFDNAFAVPYLAPVEVPALGHVGLAVSVLLLGFAATRSIRRGTRSHEPD